MYVVRMCGKATHEEIIVVGGGVIGLSISIFLSRKGYRVMVIERNKVGCEASSKNAGLVVPAMYSPYPLSIDYIKVMRMMTSKASPVKISPVRMGCRWIRHILGNRRRLARDARWKSLRRKGREAIEIIRGLVREMDIDCRYREGSILEIYTDRDYLSEAVKHAEEVEADGLRIEILDGDELREIEPSLSTSVIGGLRYVYDASLDPQAYIAGLKKLAVEEGIKIIEGIEVLGFNEDSSVRVFSRKGVFESDYLVLANGPWIRDLLNRTGYDIMIHPARGYILTLKVKNSDTLKYSLMVEEAKVVALPLGGTIRLAGIMDFVGYDTRIPHGRLEKLLTRVYSQVPILKDLEIISMETAFRPCTPDELPVIGYLPGSDKVLVAGGHCRFGLTFSGLTGLLVSQLIAGEETVIDIGIFSPSRLMTGSNM